MGKILVVDDKFGVRILLYEIFGENHEVETAANGVDALRLFSAFEPDLIVMDIKMPGMSGIETLGQIRALDRRVAVIMMTGYGDSQTMEQVKELGVHYYLDKPFNLFELKEQVREIFNNSEITPERIIQVQENCHSLLKPSEVHSLVTGINLQHDVRH